MSKASEHKHDVSDVAKQALITAIEDDLWFLLDRKYEAEEEYEYPEILPLIQAIAQCRQIQMSFPTITVHSKPIITLSHDGKEQYEG